ncbi:hypothetical protein EON65_27805 [archaeon]|nr:MAG: hypothetical protein EON65_27805 [archaeon]
MLKQCALAMRAQPPGKNAHDSNRGNSSQLSCVIGVICALSILFGRLYKMIVPQYRWIPVVANLFTEILQHRAAKHIATPPAVFSVLNDYLSKFQNPNSPMLLPVQPNPPNKDRIYANNYLNLGKVDVVGFDLDYTLVNYTPDLQSLIYSMAKETLVDAYSYPKSLLPLSFDPNFAVRGLSVDARNGVLVKLSHVQRVGLKYSYKGKRPITPEEIEEYYGGFRHVPLGDLTQLKPINDLFSLAEACLIADVIEVFEHKKLTTGEPYATEMVVDDVQAAIRDVHVSGSMHQAVVKDLDKYVYNNRSISALMEHLRKAGKKVFLCTNR